MRETADTWTRTLQPQAGEPLAVVPCQFVMVYVFGIGEVPISVSGPPLVLTVRAVGASTGRDGGLALVAGPRPGGWVSLHWDFVCDRVVSAVAARLVRTTRRALAAVNRSSSSAPALA